MRPLRPLIRTPDDGYTLTEMVVVIAIIGLIAAVVTPNLLGQLARAKAKSARLQLETISAGLEMFHGDAGRYPTGQEGLQALVSEPDGVTGWTGPYVRDAETLVDPWSRPIVYELQGERFVIRTLGADGKVGGRGADRDQQIPATH